MEIYYEMLFHAISLDGHRHSIWLNWKKSELAARPRMHQTEAIDVELCEWTRWLILANEISAKPIVLHNQFQRHFLSGSECNGFLCLINPIDKVYLQQIAI